MKARNIDLETKKRIIKTNKIRESTVEDQIHHAALEGVCIQIMSIQAAKLPIAYHSVLENVRIQH